MRYAGHKFFVKGEKGAGKTTFALSFAEYARLVGGRVKFYDVDLHGKFKLDNLKEENKEWYDIIDRVPIGSLNSLAEDLNHHDPEKWPVVIVDSVSPLESLAIRYSDRMAAKGRKVALDLAAIARTQPTREQRAATKRLQYAIWDSLNELVTDYTILTAWIVSLSKKNTKYERAIPHTQFHCDGVFRLYKTPGLETFMGGGKRQQYFLDVEDIKSGQSGVRIENPSYAALIKQFPQLIKGERGISKLEKSF